jgi:hypothetical protein
MITINNIGSGNLSAAVVAEKAQTIQPIKPAQSTAATDAGAPVAAYLSLPGFNPSTAVDTGQGAATDTNDTDGNNQAAALQAVSDSGDDALMQALKEFDDGLKSLTERPETQLFQARFGAEPLADQNAPAPAPLPGVDKNGLVRLPGADSLSADTDHDGKVSEDELRRYQEPLTYRRTEATERLDTLADGPSAFSLVEANRAYGVVSAAAATA